MALKMHTRRRIVPTWEGNDKLPEEEQISCEYTLLTVKELFALQDEVAETDKEQADALASGLAVSAATNWKVMAAVLEHHTGDYRNVTLDDVPIVTGKEFVEKVAAVNVSLVADIFGQIVGRQLGTEAEAKNSAPGSGQTGSESGAVA